MSQLASIDGATCLVTGSAGFVGSNLARALLERGCTVHGFDLAPASMTHPNLRWFQGDVRNFEDVREAARGVDVVFHTAAMIATFTYAPEAFAEFVRTVNVDGTQNVIRAAVEVGATRLVHTSSIITVPFNRPPGLGEPSEYSDAPDLYSKSKVESEKLVLAANGRAGLCTAAIRPGGIYGPGERNTIIGPLVTSLKQGAPLVVFGRGTTRMDYTYIDNLVDAQIRAAERLFAGSPVCGRAYFVTDGDPINTGNFSQTLIDHMGIDARTLRVPGPVARILARAGERVFQLFGKPKPPVSLVDVQLCLKDSFYSIDRARQDLEYEPLVSTREGLRRTAEEARQFYDSL